MAAESTSVIFAMAQCATNDQKRLGDATEIPAGGRLFRFDNLTSQSQGREKGEGAASWFAVSLNGKEFRPTMQSRWKTNEPGMASQLW